MSGARRGHGVLACAFACVLASLLAGALRAETSDPAEAASADPATSLTSEAARGPLRLRVSLSPREPRIGDMLTLEIEARAESGVEVLMPEFGEALGRFEIVDFVPATEVDDEGRPIERQRYRLQSAFSGPQRIPPIAVEFIDRRPGQRAAPDGTDAYEVLSESLEFEVASGLAEGASLELFGAKQTLAPIRDYRPLIYALLALLAIAGAVGPFVWRAYLSRRARAESRSAFDVARGELDALLARGRPSEATEMDPFFVALSSIVRRYLEARYQLRSPELTTEEFLEAMSGSPDLRHEHQQLLLEFLRQADLVKFAHHVPDADGVEASIAAVEKFLEESRERETPELEASLEEGVAHA